jgi:anti-sigma B factor antagonist
MSTKSVNIVKFILAAYGPDLSGVAASMAGIDMEITTESNATIVAFKSASMSDVDGIAAAAWKIRDLAESKRPRTLIFDFEAVKFFSSQVLGLLLDVRKKLSESGGQVMVSGINPQLHRVFKITNLDKVFQFFPNRQEALKMAKAD